MARIATSIEESKRLLELGIDPKSADMFWELNCLHEPELIVGDYSLRIQGRATDKDYRKVTNPVLSPAWSLGALMELLPADAILSFGKDEGWGVYWIDSKIASIPSTTYIGAMVKTIELLVKEGYIKGKEK